jgi:hypothetical protein
MALAGVPAALDELDHAGAEAMADRAQHHAEGGGRLALALAGVDDQQALLDGLAGQHPVAHRLLLRHLHGMTRLVVNGAGLGCLYVVITHGVSSPNSFVFIIAEAPLFGRRRKPL